MILRDYQIAAQEAIYKYFETNDGNPLIVCPTGAGKSLIIASFVIEAVRLFNARVLILSHVAEILTQNVSKIYQLDSFAPVGIYSAALRQRRINQITVASIATVYKRARELCAQGMIELVVIDEAHTVAPDRVTMYGVLLSALKEINPDIKLIGLTATPFRLGSGMLHEGEGRLFTDIAYDIPISHLIENGFLSPLVAKNAVSQGDLSQVKLQGGEYNVKQAAAAMDKEKLTDAALDEILYFGPDRKSWLLFCVDIAHCEHVMNKLLDRQIHAAIVTGETPKPERDQIFSLFRQQKIRALVNCEVCTTGLDVPCIDLIGLLRPTQSAGLYIQMVGRGSRLSPETGKENCLVMDFAGNLEQHGPIDRIEIKARGENKNSLIVTSPIKTCPTCRSITHRGAQVCKDCGFEFTLEAPIHQANAATGDIVAGNKPAEIRKYPVHDVEYRCQNSKSGYDMLVVVYSVGLNSYKDFVCIEHPPENYARQSAVAWWKLRSSEPAPDTVEEALERRFGLLKPVTIYVQRQKGYDKIISADFTSMADQEKRFDTMVKEARNEEFF